MSPIYHHQYDATVRHTSCVRRRRTRFSCLCLFCVSILCLSCVFACVWAGPYLTAVLIRFSRWFCQGNWLGNPEKSCPQLVWSSLADCTISFLRSITGRCESRALETASVDLCESPLVISCGNICLGCVDFFSGSWRHFQIYRVLVYQLELIKVALMTL